MRRWAFLLRPGWLALFVVVIAFAYLCFTVLAPWQLGKNTKTSRENAQISRSLTADPVPVTTLLPQQDSSAPDEQWRRVTATGPLPARRRRCWPGCGSIDGEPAFEVLVPFAVDGGPTVLVDRGYVRPDAGLAGARRSRPPPTGTVTITARLRDSETVAAGQGAVPRRTASSRCTRSTPGQVAAAHRRAAGGLLPATGRGPARRPRRHRAAAPRRRAVPVLRHPVDRVRHRRPDRPRATSSYSEIRRAAEEKAAAAARAAGRAQRRSPPRTKLADRYGRRR